MNFVMTNAGHFVEVQGTAEHTPFSKDQLFKMMDVADKGCRELFIHQAAIVGEIIRLA
ncbi:Ribonuclease PH [compost metagenome]